MPLQTPRMGVLPPVPTTAVRGAGEETASDDRSNYYRKAAREYGLPLSDWAVLSNYEYSPGYTDKSPLCAHVSIPRAAPLTTVTPTRAN